MGKLCQYCGKREAKIHFTEVKDDKKKTEIHLCEPCAHEKNMGVAFPSLLQHIVKGGIAPSKAEADAVPSSCPHCGLAYVDFKAKGRLGCPACYEAFQPVLVALLEKVHGSAVHSGRTPARLKGVLITDEEMEGLERELSEAVQAEEYERAARLRDRIRSLGSGTVPEESGPGGESEGDLGD
ncbi:MAG: hypothetical protein HC813_01370 [Planctomycetes bacterium]|nr:hypothetical protein [Planctomycetota bacterium]